MTATLPDITADPDAAALLRAIDDGRREALGLLCDYAVERSWEIAGGLCALRDLEKWPCAAANEWHYFYGKCQCVNWQEGQQLESLLQDEWIRRCPVLSHPEVRGGSRESPSAAILEAAAAWPG